MGVLISVFLVNGLIARVMGIDALGEFLLVRRTTFESLGVFLFGLNLGLPYYISTKEDHTYAVSAILIYVLVTIPLIGLTSTALHLGLLGGFSRTLSLPFFVFTAGYALQFVAHGLLRGHLNILGANLVQLIGTGIFPIAILLLSHQRGVPFLLTSMGLATIIFSGMVLLLRVEPGAYSNLWQRVLQLLTYGVQRVPGFMAQFILMAGVPLLILKDAGRSDIAFVNSGISLIRLFLVVAGPLGIVLLPRISKSLAAGQKVQVARGLDILGKTVLLVSVPLALFLSMHSLTLLSIWLGSGGEVGTGIVQLIVLALPFYLLTVVYRSPIDAASARGYNSIVYGIAAVTLLIAYYGLKTVGLSSLDAGVFSFIAGHLTAAIVSMYYAHKLYEINLISPYYLMTLLGTAGFLSLLFYPVKILVPGFLSFLINGVTLAAVLSVFFLKSRSEWVAGLRSLVIVR